MTYKCFCVLLQSLGPVSQMTDDSVVVQMGCITRGFANAELEKLPFSLDTLEAIAHCGWNESQVKELKQPLVRKTVTLIIMMFTYRDDLSQ